MHADRAICPIKSKQIKIDLPEALASQGLGIGAALGGYLAPPP